MSVRASLVRICLGALLWAATTLSATESATANAGIQWHAWSDHLLEIAKDQDKLVLLDLTAAWCAFCKKMDRVTYRDMAVEQVINKHYIAVRISDEADPVLAARYADYGRPASVVLNGEGQELIRRRGYLEPQLMTWMLQAVAQNPDPEAHR